MRTGTRLTISAVAVSLFVSATANAHLIHSGPEAAAHNGSHALPMALLAAVLATLFLAAYRFLKSR